MNKLILAFGLITLLSIDFAAGLSCYTCDDTGPTKCNDLQDKDRGECPANASPAINCFKHGKENARKHGCTGETDAAFCKSAAAPKDNCVVCSIDNCNSSGSMLASAFLIAASAFLLKMFH